MLKTTKKINFLKLIESALDAEMSRDLETQRDLFRPFWDDLNRDPEIEDCEPILHAQLLSICGHFLNNYGRSRLIPNFGERSLDLITRAIIWFEVLGAFEKAAEAKCYLAVFYWRQGSVEETEAILDDAEVPFENNQLHRVYLWIQINRLVVHYWSENLQKAFELISAIKISMEFCHDYRLQTMFHNQAGLCFWHIKDYRKSVEHFKEAQRFAIKSKNLRYEGMISNNLANTFRLLGDLKNANIYIEKAFEIFNSLEDYGWLSSILDTKAQIRLAEGYTDAALEIIDQSLKIQYKGNDSVALIESLWTKCEILFYLERKSEALAVYGELAQLANTQLGRKTVEKYSKQLANLIHINKGASFEENVKFYKKSLIRRALAGAGGKLIEAARRLQMSHQVLSSILLTSYPDLREEFNLTKRTPRGTKILSPKTDKKKRAQPAVKAIKRLNADEIPFKFNSGLTFDKSNLRTFIVPAALMLRFDIEADAVVCVLKGQCQPDAPAMIYRKEEKTFDCGNYAVDTFSGFVYLDDFEPQPVMPDEILSVGNIVGYCLLDDLQDSEIVFNSLG